MFNVSRQIQYSTGLKIVEVGVGDFNYANPDIESDIVEFTDPRDAVKAAIEIQKEWQAKEKDLIHLGYGCTRGFTAPFEPCSESELICWAEKRYQKLTKCEGCLEIIEDGDASFFHDLKPDVMFHSEICAEIDYQYLKDMKNESP